MQTDLIGAVVQFGPLSERPGERGRIRAIYLDEESEPMYVVRLSTGILEAFYAHAFVVLEKAPKSLDEFDGYTEPPQKPEN